MMTNGRLEVGDKRRRGSSSRLLGWELYAGGE
jgi:hypothetical protein